MDNLSQYGVAAAVTYLLLKEIFTFLVKMRGPKNNPGPVCSFTAAEDGIKGTLTDIRDGINKLVVLSENRRGGG